MLEEISTSGRRALVILNVALPEGSRQNCGNRLLNSDSPQQFQFAEQWQALESRGRGYPSASRSARSSSMASKGGMRARPWSFRVLTTRQSPSSSA